MLQLNNDSVCLSLQFGNNVWRIYIYLFLSVTYKRRKEKGNWGNKALFDSLFSFLFSFSVFSFDYKSATSFSVCFLFSEFCIAKSENIKKLFTIFYIQNFENRKKNENKMIFLYLKLIK